MQIGVVTSSYKNSAIETREKLAIDESEVTALIGQLKRETDIKEAMLLSTCNRVEIYFQSEEPLKVCGRVIDRFLAFRNVSKEHADEFLQLVGRDAVEHIFRVASSLEAMVIGEPQITGQVRNFFHLSMEAKGCGFLLNQIMNRAFVTAKRIRNETDIAKFAVSISFAAVELAKKIFFGLKDKVILVVGAGEMAELAIGHLLKAGCVQLFVANRTFSRAVVLAERFNGSAVRFEHMERHLENADIVISSTGARGFVLDRKMVQHSMKRRKYRSMFFIDIAVPRDIDPKVNGINNCYVYDIDDLQSVVDANLDFRQKEAEKAGRIVEEELDRIDEWLMTLDVVPTIRKLRERILDLANAELIKGLSEFGELSAKQERCIRAMINGLAYKILHNPTVMLKEKAKEGVVDLEYVRTINDLFDLESRAAPTVKNNILKLK